MIEPPDFAGGADEAPMLWWEATAEGTEVAVALVRIERVHADREASGAAAADTELRRQARFTAGVEYIARAFGAAQPLAWERGGTTLLLGGGAAEDLPARAYLAAKELWERARIDLDLPVRIGASVGIIRRGADLETSAADELALCGRLAAVAPAGAVVLSEDLALALRDEDRRDIASLGRTAQGGVPAWVFPAGAAFQRDPAAFEESRDQALWDAFRRHALGPDVRMLRYVGFRLQKHEPPSLDLRDVFVAPQAELQVRREAGQDARIAGGPPGPGSTTERKDHGPTRSIGLRDLFARHRSLVVLGDPGSGKTTLIRWLAVTAASGRFLLGAQLGIPERLLPLPVSVGLLAEVVGRGRLDGDDGDGAAEVSAVLGRYFHDRGVGEAHDISGFLERMLEAGSCLLLLDGLDEVRAGEQVTLRARLEAFAARYPKNRFIATSRVVGFTGLSLLDAAQVTLKPFDDAEVERYVRAFARAYARWELGSDDAGRGELDADRLLGALRENGRLLTIARNPFMLSALALVHRAEGRLPRHRVQAYELFARALCETWADARRLVAGGPAGVTLAYEEEALPILGELALAMHRRYPAGIAPKAFVVETLAKALGERRTVCGEEAERAANAFLERAGREVQILLERGAGAWGFLHLTFQEFFAAAGLHALERFEEEAFAHLFEPRWEEVLRLGVGYLALVQKRPEAARRFVQKVLEYEAPEPERWLTSVLKKQVPLAALLAAEAGDALPESMKRRVAEAFARWVCDPPGRDAIVGYLYGLSCYDFRDVLGDALLDALAEHRNDGEKILDAISWLGPSSPSGAERLLALSEGVSGDEFRAFAQALGVYYLSVSWDGLVALLHDDRPLVRAAALSVLPSDEPHAIVDALNDENSLVRDMAAEWLAEQLIFNSLKLDDDDRDLLLSGLRGIAKDRSASARGAAAFVMGSIGAEQDVEALLIDMCLHDEDEGVRERAAAALGTLNSIVALDALADPSTFVRMNTAETVQEMPPAFTLEKLLTMIADRSEHGRAGAARALGTHPDARARAAVIAATEDAVPEVRAAALWGLLGKPAEHLHERLLAALQDEYLEVRGAAIAVLGSSHYLPAMGKLVDATHASEAVIRRASVAALGCFFVDQEEAQTAVMTAIEDPDPDVRRTAVELLGTSLGIMSAAVWFERLCGAFTDSSADVRAAVARVLGDHADPSAIPHLLRSLPDNPAAREALWKIAARLHQPEPLAAP